MINITANREALFQIGNELTNRNIITSAYLTILLMILLFYFNSQFFFVVTKQINFKLSMKCESVRNCHSKNKIQ